MRDWYQAGCWHNKTWYLGERSRGGQYNLWQITGHTSHMIPLWSDRLTACLYYSGVWIVGSIFTLLERDRFLCIGWPKNDPIIAVQLSKLINQIKLVSGNFSLLICKSLNLAIRKCSTIWRSVHKCSMLSIIRGGGGQQVYVKQLEFSYFPLASSLFSVFRSFRALLRTKLAGVYN